MNTRFWIDGNFLPFNTIQYCCQIQIAKNSHFFVVPFGRRQVVLWSMVKDASVAGRSCQCLLCFDRVKEISGILLSWLRDLCTKVEKTGSDMASEHVSIVYSYFTMLAAREDVGVQLLLYQAATWFHKTGWVKNPASPASMTHHVNIWSMCSRLTGRHLRPKQRKPAGRPIRHVFNLQWWVLATSMHFVRDWPKKNTSHGQKEQNCFCSASTPGSYPAVHQIRVESLDCPELDIFSCHIGSTVYDVPHEISDPWNICKCWNHLG